MRAAAAANDRRRPRRPAGRPPGSGGPYSARPTRRGAGRPHAAATPGRGRDIDAKAGREARKPAATPWMAKAGEASPARRPGEAGGRAGGEGEPHGERGAPALRGERLLARRGLEQGCESRSKDATVLMRGARRLAAEQRGHRPPQRPPTGPGPARQQPSSRAGTGGGRRDGEAAAEGTRLQRGRRRCSGGGEPLTGGRASPQRADAEVGRRFAAKRPRSGRSLTSRRSRRG